MEFERIVVFGDLHGDLDTMLASLSEKRLVRYEHELDEITEQIKVSLNEPFAPSLEAMVIPQTQPVRVIFLGDLLDRYHFGYHIIQFLDKIRWENFGIYPIFLLGNHDLLNFHFFINPFELADIYHGCGHSKSDTVSYVNGMGISESLDSFKILHRDEIINMQMRFYETGTLQFQEAGYSLQYQYPSDLSALAKYRYSHDYMAYFYKMATELGLESEKPEDKHLDWHAALPHYLFNLLGKITSQSGQRNWWDISNPHDRENYHWRMSKFNLFMTVSENEDNIDIAPIDWRVISLIWRYHYGNFFRRARLLHHEGTTLFVHAGISPLAMMDPLVFGNLYDPRHDTFKPLRAKYDRDLSLEKVINRSNRLVAQVIENALNDYSFKRMNGTEVVDQMGYWRGVSDGYPIFGGPIWSDFNFLQQNVKQHDKIQKLYKAFQEATGIKRLICGHTHFQLREKPNIRYLMSSEHQNLGLEYLCVDNACSRGYRNEPVLNGIVIDRKGNIQAPGQVCTSSMLW